jgi:hypothetical protein
MKKLVFTLSIIGFAFYGYSQNEAKANELTSPIMIDFLKNYQQENTIKKFQLPSTNKFQLPPNNIPFTSDLSKRGIKGDKNVKPELENIDNMIVVKPNLVAIMRMPIIRPDENTGYRMRIVNSDTNKSKPVE